MKSKIVIPFLALGHGINDLLAGYFLGCLASSSADITRIGLSLLMYNLLAFGGQYPIAILLERIGHHQKMISGAFLLNLGAALLFFNVPSLAVVMAGIASAIYHVAGGSVCASGNKALPIGLFAAPGVAGLIAGGYLAWEQYALQWPMAGICILFLLLLQFVGIPNKVAWHRENAKAEAATGIHLDKHDLIMILLLLIISLRSAVWNIFQLLHEQQYDWLLAIALAAFAGKILGGWLADRIGWKAYTYLSMIAAAPLISFFRNELLLFCIGIGLLQSGIPATTALLIRSVNGKKERGIALSFGAAIILGAFVLVIPQAAFTSSILLPLGLLAIMGLLFWITDSKKLTH
ncbi:MAG: hypothetical protein KA229_11020 [Chitinophagaceae bacterium]|nr:hypothetical protein [Chitinophagaceae bacterium]